MRPSHEERFWSRVEKTESCWLWRGNMGRKGYGQFSVGKSCRFAHRFAYELLVGPIPEALVIDHLCRVPACVNPAHLEPVTERENILRGISPAAKNAQKTHCVRGHILPRDRNPRGARQCQECRNIKQRERRALLPPSERGVGAWNREKTHCKNGHEYTPENTWVCKSNSRHCRECGRRRSTEYKRRIKAAA